MKKRSETILAYLFCTLMVLSLLWPDRKRKLAKPPDTVGEMWHLHWSIGEPVMPASFKIIGDTMLPCELIIKIKE